MNRKKREENFEFSGPQELAYWVYLFSKKIGPKTCLLLIGELGAGKTTLVQELVKAFGGEDASSPSFAIHNRYESKRGSIDHLDLYRLESVDDLESTGFWDLFSQEKGLLLVEWGDRLNVDDLPLDWPLIELRLTFVGESSNSGRKLRVVTYD